MTYAPGIAIVAPSGYAPDVVALERAIARFEARGCWVKSYYDPAAIYQRFGADDEARAAQLHAAARDSEVDLVLALRGGYGLSRLLPLLDVDLLARSGKRFVGHSDFTVLHMALLAHSQTVSFAGPMVCDDFSREDPSDFTMRHFWDCLSQSAHTVSAAVSGNPRISVSGTLWGGNLTMLCHLLGTPYFPRIEQGILFVEDVNEHPYRVERLLLQLQHAGVLEKQQALVLGDFSGYRLTPYDNGYDFDTMLAYLRQRLSVPVVTGLPFGHIRDKATLAVGAHAELSCTATHLNLSMAGYPAPAN
jgi:muramoyltetrapeptide carboxypeptidase